VSQWIQESAAGVSASRDNVWRKLRTTNILERRSVQVRRRTRPMGCALWTWTVSRIIYSISQRFNLAWKTRTLKLFTQAAW